MRKRILLTLMLCLTLSMIGCTDRQTDHGEVNVEIKDVEAEENVEKDVEVEEKHEIMVMNLLDTENNVFQLNEEDAETIMTLFNEAGILECNEDYENNVQIIIDDKSLLYHSSYGILTSHDDNKMYTLLDKTAFNDILDNYIILTVMQNEKEPLEETVIDIEKFDEMLMKNEKIVILETEIKPAKEGDAGAEQVWSEDGLIWGIINTVYKMGNEELTPYYELDGDKYAFSVVLQDKDGNIYCSISNDMVSEDGVAQLTVVEKEIYDQLMDYYY